MCGAAVRALAAHQTSPGSIPARYYLCGLSLLLVLALLTGFFSQYFGFPPEKSTFPNSNST